ncbi:hypothetical protein D3C71_23310 [compost metagenome]
MRQLSRPAAASRQRDRSIAPAQGPTTDARVDRELRRILTNTLDALKNPAAIPSQVISHALREARRV